MEIDMQGLQYESKERMYEARVRDAQYRGAFRLTALCLSVMCFLQVTLNIALRLHSKPCCDHMLLYDGVNLQSTLSKIDPRMPGLAFGSSVYYMSTTERKNWTQSRDDCESRNATLVIITSKEEQDFIEMFRRGKSAWIGLSDLDSKGVWKWVDGSTLSTSFWWTGEPNNINGRENCVETGYNPRDGRTVTDVLATWNDNLCSVEMSWICEKAISPL